MTNLLKTEDLLKPILSADVCIFSSDKTCVCDDAINYSKGKRMKTVTGKAASSSGLTSNTAGKEETELIKMFIPK